MTGTVRIARRAAVAALALTACLGLWAPAPRASEAAPSAEIGPLEIRRIADGARIEGVEGLAALLRAHDLGVLGEIHDNPRHQALQAALAAAARASALAFEMTPRAAEAALARLRAAQAAGDAAGAAALEAEALWSDYADHHGVMAAAPAAAVAGAGLPREALIRAMREGAAAAFEGDAARWGLKAALPPEVQADVEAEMVSAHCDALPAEMAPAMAEAQRLRDAAFAAALLRARAAAAGAAGASDGPALLITGNGHARRDRGAPAFLGRVAPELSAISVLAAERAPGDADWRDALARWTPDPEAPPLFDVIAITDPEARGDPCAAFRARGAD